MKISKKENISLIKIKKQKIKIILNIPKNNECFECSNTNPEFISLNNGIFLCKDCIKNHKNFPKSISNIFKNDLNNLTLKNIQYLCCGGNEKLKQFIHSEFPKLKKFSFQNLYKTYAMNYYRKYLEYLIEGGIKPIKPNLNKAYELIKINNNIKQIKNNNKVINNQRNKNIEGSILKENNNNINNEKKNDLLRIAKSSGKHRPNLNIILPNFNNSLNNFNTINIYNYNDKIYTETYYKKKFFSPIFRNNFSEIKEQNNSSEIKNITFNKEENNYNLNYENIKKEPKRLDTNIKIMKKKVFLDNQYINYQNNNIYEKPFFQNYVNTVNRGKGIKNFHSGYDLYSFDSKYFSNDIKDMSHRIDISNTRNNLLTKKTYTSKKIFKKKTVGNSFSIHYKNHSRIDINNSKENNYNHNYNIININKKNIKNEPRAEILISDSREGKVMIKVNKQINMNKKRKRYSLSDLATDNQYNDNIKKLIKDKEHKKKFDNIEKAKIFERIRRITSSRKNKNNNNYSERDISEIDSQKTEKSKNNFNNKEYKINKKDKSSLLIKDMINKPSNIKKNILEIIKSNNISNVINSPTKKIIPTFTEPKSLIKKDNTTKFPVKEFYQRKKMI